MSNETKQPKLRRIRIVGDGTFTRVFDAETGEEIRFVKHVEFEHRVERNGMLGKPLVHMTIAALASEVDVIGETLEFPEPEPFVVDVEKQDGGAK